MLRSGPLGVPLLHTGLDSVVYSVLDGERLAKCLGCAEVKSIL